MAVYNVHGGHNKIVPGASSYLDEVTEDRRVTAEVISLLKSAGHTVYDCTDDSGRTQSANLANIVAKCNAHTAALDVSIHFNAAAKDGGDGKVKGVEVYVYSSTSKAKNAATRVCANFAALGFTNRGVKTSSSLYVLRRTKSPAMLIEACFVDDKDDADLYNKIGYKAVAQAIASGIAGQAIPAVKTATSVDTPPKTNPPAYKIGNTYTLQVELKVRSGAGTNYAAKKHNQLTADGQKHDTDKDGALDKGTKVTCKEVKNVGKDIWMRTPSGWVAAYYNGQVYIK